MQLRLFQEDEDDDLTALSSHLLGAGFQVQVRACGNELHHP